MQAPTCWPQSGLALRATSKLAIKLHSPTQLRRACLTTFLRSFTVNCTTSAPPPCHVTACVCHVNVGCRELQAQDSCCSPPAQRLLSAVQPDASSHPKACQAQPCPTSIGHGRHACSMVAIQSCRGTAEPLSLRRPQCRAREDYTCPVLPSL